MNNAELTTERRAKAYISPIATNLIHLRNPLVTALWSFLFPGFGQVALGSYLKGYLLIIWEIVVNTQAEINIALMYTFTGRFEEATAVVNHRWLLLYTTVYLYSIWEGYRSTVDLNKLTILAQRSGNVLSPFKMNEFSINYLDKRNPWVAAAWSTLMPGLGHLYAHRLPAGIFVLLWWIAIAYFSHLMEVLEYTLLGDYAKAVAIADWRWLLFMPSLHWFAIFDSYTITVEFNKLFTREQADYLRREYFNSAVDIFSEEGEAAMLIISTFEHSVSLELAISDIEVKGGIPKANILAAPLTLQQQHPQMLDSIHRADGISQIDGAFLAAAFSSVIFSIYGSIWPGGPILWGLLGLLIGGGVGLALDTRHTKKVQGRKDQPAPSEVVLIIKCDESQASFVEKTLIDHVALGIVKVG